MKVLMLITKSNWGGAQRYVYDLATNLPKESFDVEVMASGNGTLINKLIETGIKADGNLPIGRNVKFFEDIKAFFKLIKIIREKKPDVLHVNSSKIGGLGALAGRFAGVPNIIFTAHGWAFNEERPIWMKAIIKISYWIIIMLSHTTIAVSEMTKDQMINWPFVLKKMTVIHNGIKPEPIFSKVNARNELAKLNPRFSEIIKKTSARELLIIGSVGELHHIKGYEYALRAIHEITSQHKIFYLIFGNGEEKEKIEKDIEDLKLKDSVIMFGHVSQAYQYLKAFDLFLLPSLSEGLPYIALEAGLASLPIIATAVGGIPEVIDDMKSGILIQARKSKEIRHAIEFYTTHKKVQKEYSLAISEKIKKEFTIEEMISKTTKIYLKHTYLKKIKS